MRATTAAYRDLAGKGTALAERIWNEAQGATITALSLDAVLLDEAVTAGTLKVTVSHLDQVQPHTLPETGGGWATPGLTVVMAVAFGFVLLLAGAALRRAAR